MCARHIVRARCRVHPPKGMIYDACGHGVKRRGKWLCVDAGRDVRMELEGPQTSSSIIVPNGVRMSYP